MTPYFGDTYYFVALLNPHDEAHREVVKFNNKLRQPIVTSSLVLTEIADGLAGAPSRRSVPILVRMLMTDSRFTVVTVDMPLFNRGLELYEARPDKEWSLTDCVSFLIMEDMHIDEALTADHHFEQAGFRAVLKFS